MIISILEKKISLMVSSLKNDIANLKASFTKVKEKITNKINQLKEISIEKSKGNNEIFIDEDINKIENILSNND